MKNNNLNQQDIIKQIEDQKSKVNVFHDQYSILRSNFLGNLFHSRKSCPQKPKLSDILRTKKLYKAELKKLNQLIEQQKEA